MLTSPTHQPAYPGALDVALGECPKGCGRQFIVMPRSNLAFFEATVRDMADLADVYATGEPCQCSRCGYKRTAPTQADIEAEPIDDLIITVAE